MTWRRLRRALGLALVLACRSADPSAQTPTPAPAPGGLGLVEAVRLTLDQQPSIKLQQERLITSQGDLRAAVSQFDTKFSSDYNRIRSDSANTAIEQEFQQLPPSSVSTITNYAASLQRQSRSGRLFTPSVSMERTDVTGLPIPGTRAAVSLLMVQPLLRGRGEPAVTAAVRAGEREVEANRTDLTQTRAIAVLSTAFAYWNYVAAANRLAIFRDAEARARRIADETRILIEADNRPASDLKQVLANLADSVASRIGGEKGLYQARQDLGIALGLPYEQIEGLPLPADLFPAAVDPAMMPPLESLTAAALAGRADLQSAISRESGARAQIVQARNAVRPQLDVVASVGYAGLDEGGAVYKYLSPFSRNLTGPNFTLNFTWSHFLENNGALGRLARTESALSQAEIRRLDLGRTIRSAVAVAYDDLRRSAEQVKNSREASGYYQSAVEDERTKQGLGRSTVIDLLNTEDRLTRTRLDQVTSEQAYANALISLRFESGTLLGGDGTSPVDMEQLTTVPVARPPQ